MTQASTSHPAVALRATRTARGLTLRALAAKTGMPYSTLSKLENGKTALTYDKLMRLAQGLEVDVADLVAAPTVADAPALGRRSITRAGQSLGADSERHAHWFPAADMLGKLMVPTLTDVTARSVEDVGGLLRHSGEEYLYVLEGSMALHSDLYAPLFLDTGDSVYFDSGMAHAYVCTSEAPCRVLSVCAGAGVQTLAEAARQRGGPSQR